MGTAKKKTKAKIQASDVVVRNQTLEGVLLELAERAKANDIHAAEARERSKRFEEIVAEARARSARAEERSARAEERSARAEERSARAEELSARAEQRATIALETIAAVIQDLRALAQRTDDRFAAVEKTIAAE